MAFDYYSSQTSKPSCFVISFIRYHAESLPEQHADPMTAVHYEMPVPKGVALVGW